MKQTLLLTLSFIGFVVCKEQAYATHFDDMDSPYGGCGLPSSLVTFPHYLALNVQNTPGDYENYLHRPIYEEGKVGAFNNGHNCGRFITVTLGKKCKIQRTTTPESLFCDEEDLEDDEYTGAHQMYQVADACQDGHKWCRDDKNHVDLQFNSLKNFYKFPRKIDVTKKWGTENRQVTWEYTQGPLTLMEIYFAQNANPLLPLIIISQISNGIDRVQQRINGQWVDATMNGDMGQQWILHTTKDNTYQIKVIDVNGKAYHEKAYTFTFNRSICKNLQCGIDHVAFKVNMIRSDILYFIDKPKVLQSEQLFLAQ
ncbi:UNKNOWN [Stylonychia lemnae]|uniref:Uncharacterized protein n=1 Tax=Stylonychia lemnae TaxID=5949 RepID=A0A078B4H2_STYLE|nr:UNKNOWN [Stylonychia lemnae]|eukprot:CDW89420.1 UNKNOWN [Stylonychia lemnae]